MINLIKAKLEHFRIVTESHGDGDYCGQMLNNQKHGMGILKKADGRILEGTWKQGQVHGILTATENGNSRRFEFNMGEYIGQVN